MKRVYRGSTYISDSGERLVELLAEAGAFTLKLFEIALGAVNDGALLSSPVIIDRPTTDRAW